MSTLKSYEALHNLTAWYMQPGMILKVLKFGATKRKPKGRKEALGGIVNSPRTSKRRSRNRSPAATSVVSSELTCIIIAHCYTTAFAELEYMVHYGTMNVVKNKK
jgi:hypothetical protein